MRLSTFLFSTLFTTASIGQSVKFSGNIEGAEKDTLYFYALEADGIKAIDSVVLDEKGSFKQKLDFNSFTYLRLGFKPNNFSLLLIDPISDKKISVSSSQKDELLENLNVEGSLYSQKGIDFLREGNAYFQYQSKTQQELQSLSGDERTALTNELRDKAQAFIKLRDTFIQRNANTPLPLLAVQYVNPKNEFPQYFDIVESSIKALPNHSYTEQLENARKGMIVVGNYAPEIAYPDTAGVTRKLSDLKGKIVLLDFWASWCGPCRRENPNVVAMYKKYVDSGFTVFSVSLDRNEQRWEQAILKDNLIWPNHVSDLKQWQSEPAKLYGVRSIPSTFLIDREGKIMSLNVRGHQLNQKLEEIFGY